MKSSWPLLSLALMTANPRLPHAYPFRFIAREEGAPDLLFTASGDDAVSRGGLVPAHVVLEALTQAAGLMAATEGSTGGVLVQVARYRCPRPVRPGDRLNLSGVLLVRMGPLLRVRMTARREGRLVAGGVLTLRESKP